MAQKGMRGLTMSRACQVIVGCSSKRRHKQSVFALYLRGEADSIHHLRLLRCQGWLQQLFTTKAGFDLCVEDSLVNVSLVV